MTTFAGNYIKEPSDLRVVCSEADIIAACDDPGGEDTRDVLTFATLTVDQKSAVVSVVDSLIPAAESLVESYATPRGYAIPLSPVDPLVVELTARLVWISMRQRAGSLTADAAEKQREDIRNGQLRDIAAGRCLLTAAKTGTTAPSSNVYAASSANQRDTTGTTERLSRASLGVLG